MTDLHSSRWAYSSIAALAAALLIGACGGTNRSAQSPQASEDTSGSGVTSSATVTAVAVAADGDAPGPGTLADAAIRRGVARQIATAHARCGSIDRKIDRYETTLHLEIDARGTVEVARARGNHPLLDACIGDVAKTWQFEPSSGRTVAELPIVIAREITREGSRQRPEEE